MHVGVERKEWVRGSCVALCRVEHNGRYLLLLNRNRRHKGLYTLSPVGGALQIDDPTALEALGARFEDPAARELRFMLPKAQLDTFRVWFYRGEGRERSPWRELYEELVEECHLLVTLQPADVQITPLYSVESEELTDRQGQTGLLTHYFLEVYDVKFLRAATFATLRAAPPESGAVWLSEEQLRSGRPLRLRFDGAERLVQVRGRALLPPHKRASRHLWQARSENSLNSEGRV